MDIQTFQEHIRHAIERLYDPTYLQTHPLLEILDLPRATMSNPGDSLRHAIWQAVEQLRPAEDVPQDRPAWHCFRLLSLHYVEGQSVEMVCSALGLSPRSFRRRRKEGIEAVASILWRQAKNQSSPPAQVDAPALWLDAARQFAQATGMVQCHLDDIVHDIRETVLPLATPLSINLEFHGEGVVFCGGPALLSQVVVNIIAGVLGAVSGDTLQVQSSLQSGRLLWRLEPFNKHRLAAALTSSQEIQVARALLDACEGQFAVNRDREHDTVVVTVPVPDPPVVLAVDDNPETTELYARYLGRSYLVQQASSVAEAQRRVKERRPDVVLLDVLMPLEDGWKLLRSLRSDDTVEPIPIIVCSVLSQPSIAHALGADCVLQKPVSASDLQRSIQALLAPRDSQQRQRPA